MNITLIGMPGSGKSAVGRELANILKYPFIDIDVLIEGREKKALQTILDELGEDAFIKLEADMVLGLVETQRSIISPGGSIMYSPEAMEFLKDISAMVYLNVPIERIMGRIDVRSRGIVHAQSLTLPELFEERARLYQGYADVAIEPGEESPRLTAERIISMLS